MTPDYDVLIVGAGPAGSSLAIRLAHRGLSVLIIDRSRFPRSKPCAEYLSPAGVDQLADLGVLSQLAGRGVELKGTTVIASGGSRMTGLFAATRPAEHRSTGLALPRLVLDDALLQAAVAAGAEAWQGCSLESLTREGSLVTGAVLRLAGRRIEVRAAITVGADGLNSRVRQALGGYHQEPLDRMAIVARLSGVDATLDRAELRVAARGYLGLNPLPGGITNVALVVPSRDMAQARGDLGGYFVDRLRSWPGLEARIGRLEFIDPPRATGPFARRARRVVADGAILVGDAADFFDPFTGEGINAALTGAGLADKAITRALSRGQIRASSMGGYLRDRRRTFGGKWVVERMIGYGMQAPRLFDRAIDRIGRKGAMAHTMIGVTGDYLPARDVLNPAYLFRMVW